MRYQHEVKVALDQGTLQRRPFVHYQFRAGAWYSYVRHTENGKTKYAKIIGQPNTEEWETSYQAILRKYKKINREEEIFKRQSGEALRGLDYINAISIDPKNTSCIYFLLKKEKVVYIGQTVNPLLRIRDHSRNKDFDRVAFLHCPESKLNDLEKDYINKFSPALNKNLSQSYRRPRKHTDIP